MAKKITSAKRTKSTTDIPKKRRKQQIAAAGIVTALAICFIGVLMFLSIQPAPVTGDSSFVVIDHVSRDVVTGVSGELYEFTPDEITTVSQLYDDGNWALLDSGAIDELTVDMNDHPYGLWLRVVDATYHNEWVYLQSFDGNYVYYIEVHLRPTTVYFSNVNSTDLSQVIPDAGTSENYTLTTQFPWNEVDTTIIRPSYSLPADTYGHYNSSEARMTNTFGFLFTANETIGDGVLSINITLASSFWDYVIEDQYIIFYSKISARTNMRVHYEMSLGNNITISEISTVLIDVPGITVEHADVSVLETRTRS